MSTQRSFVRPSSNEAADVSRSRSIEAGSRRPTRGTEQSSMADLNGVVALEPHWLSAIEAATD
jgi:hypothetical protein